MGYLNYMEYFDIKNYHQLIFIVIFLTTKHFNYYVFPSNQIFNIKWINHLHSNNLNRILQPKCIQLYLQNISLKPHKQYNIKTINENIHILTKIPESESRNRSRKLQTILKFRDQTFIQDSKILEFQFLNTTVKLFMRNSLIRIEGFILKAMEPSFLLGSTRPHHLISRNRGSIGWKIGVHPVRRPGPLVGEVSPREVASC